MGSHIGMIAALRKAATSIRHPEALGAQRRASKGDGHPHRHRRLGPAIVRSRSVAVLLRGSPSGRALRGPVGFAPQDDGDRCSQSRKEERVSRFRKRFEGFAILVHNLTCDVHCALVVGHDPDSFQPTVNNINVDNIATSPIELGNSLLGQNDK
jgi:hypothetical protein